MIINVQPEKTKCMLHQPGRNCPLDNKDADPNTFCEAYKQGDGYICNAIAMNDPVEDDLVIVCKSCTNKDGNMKVETKIDTTITRIELGGGSDSKIRLEIGKEDQQKINKWLNEILGNGEGIDTMYFPQLTYTFDVRGNIGSFFNVKEGITNKELDLTDIDKW